MCCYYLACLQRCKGPAWAAGDVCIDVVYQE